ncbi:hypothetical protein L914_15970 [Phytophthora nicotianae]|uniref:Uncharacterized protein n=2 Tax=Phytophthora nicotianae TaxID=4792 RepID=V9EDY8_PHYNI|nr:hypothetical protein F443_16613 [Phytophthora nicotianae P1569]ETM37483.1 hypothetical protein L914_15970 [Phytophthora nicotianae]
MEIVAVDRWLQLSAVDEDESEAVAISCVEFLLSETNAYYQQKCLAQEVFRSVSSHLRNNVLDTVCVAVLEAEQTMSDDRFQPDSRPEAEVKDRHAVRCVPSKSPDKSVSTISTLLPKMSSSPASRVGSSPDKLRSRAVVSPTRRKRKPSKGEAEKAMPPIHIIEQDGDPDDENPETKAWRDKCIKTLETSTKKTGFAKWANLARVFAVPETRVSMEAGTISAPPPNVVEALAATPVVMKTNVDSFSSISDHSESIEVPSDEATRRASRRLSVLSSPARSLQPMSSIAENSQSKRRSQSAHVSDSTVQQKRKTTLLSDSLSHQRMTRKFSSTESLAGSPNSTSSRSLWHYEMEAGSATSPRFDVDGTEFNATTLAATMSVASGVVLLQGESVVEGPEWVDGATTMSRKRFDLQQRLATDALLNASSEIELYSPRCSSLGSPLLFGHYPASPMSELHFRDYEEVPPEPIPIPQLSPISTSSLAIPRTHLTASLSTPSLRVRTAASSVKAGCSLNNSISRDNGSSRSTGTASSSISGQASLGTFKPRPTTALRAITAPPKIVSGRARASSAAPGKSRLAAQSMKNNGTASAKYLREFPKPKAGVVRVVSDQAVGLLTSVQDRQRTAWMS